MTKTKFIAAAICSIIANEADKYIIPYDYANEVYMLVAHNQGKTICYKDKEIIIIKPAAQYKSRGEVYHDIDKNRNYILDSDEITIRINEMITYAHDKRR